MQRDAIGERKVTLLDYGAGNMQSIRNALMRFGVELVYVKSAADVLAAEALVFPGVGAFGQAMVALKKLGLVEALKTYLSDSSRPFLGICIGMQALFEGSSEAPGVPGLGVLKGRIERFNFLDEAATKYPVPHIGWNGSVAPTNGKQVRESRLVDHSASYYFVHSYRTARCEWACGVTAYGPDVFVSAIERDAQFAVQFHPEKSGKAGLGLIERFLVRSRAPVPDLVRVPQNWWQTAYETRLALRIVCALDVRTNDEGDLVVTKGDGYDVRERTSDGRKVRNLGKPVELCRRYYEEGGDEIAILNICAFKGEPLADLPLLDLLRRASTEVFVPLTIGGGIRSYVDNTTGDRVEALQVADAYFRAGADKVSIGSDAVYAALDLLHAKDSRQQSSIEQISAVYGAQAVVVSIDPKRVNLDHDQDPPITATVCNLPDGSRCWYQCTVSGGRKLVDLDAVALAIASEKLGAGELMVNCIDCDGKKSGFDVTLLNAVKQAVTIPVIASSGAGCPQHFLDVFQEAQVDAALAAGIFHRKEVAIADVKRKIHEAGHPSRLVSDTRVND